MKKHKSKIITGILIAVILVIAFLGRTDVSNKKSINVAPEKKLEQVKNDEPSANMENDKENVSKEEEKESKGKDTKNQKETADNKEEKQPEKINYDAKNQPSEKTSKADEILKCEQVNPSETVTEQKEVKEKDLNDEELISEESIPLSKIKEDEETDKEYTCTLSVKCDTILNNIGKLDEEKLPLVPANGVIYEEKTVVFYEGESVFDLLLREMKQNKIHLEFEDTPIYNSAYIEGIGNLYEFDCGELSGWMYKVNGAFPNYGCSRYLLADGDNVEWVYTCDLGSDVGGNNF